MKVTNAAARLARLGDESSGIWRKARESVDAIAIALMKYARAAGMEGEKEIPLPRRYSFACWPAGTWKLTKNPSPQKLVDDSLHLNESSKSTKCLLRFAEDIATGWLDEVVRSLEQETAKLKQLTNQVDRTLTAAKI